jgi:demethylmenaquinone methyltransferase / 2-methoxy-6-polyprenyl-1,4-benzoquinol methylase
LPLITGDRNRFAQELFTSLPSRYDRLAEVLSMGQNGRWRRAMVDHIVPAAPAKVLDVASGTAGVALQLASRTSADVVGVDLTIGMLAQGHRNVAQAGMSTRVQLVAGRAEQLPFPDATFDALTFTYLLRYVEDPQATLRELARVVKPGGAVASLEFFLPPSAFWRFWWWWYTRLVLPAGGWLTGGREWFTVGRFLGPNISGHYRKYPLEWTEAAWRQAGFENVGVRVMSLGGGLVMWGTRSRE